MASRRAKILFLAHRVPYPPNRGDRIRSFHLLEYLARRADVSLAFLAEEPPSPETWQALRQRCAQVVGIPLGRCRRWLSAVWSLARGRTATEGLFRSGRLRRLLRRWSETTGFDAVMIYCSSMVQYLDVLGLAGAPVVVDLVDVDSQKWLDYAEGSRGARRWLYQIEGKRLRRLEQSLPAQVNHVILVSRSEADLYRSFCAAGSVQAVHNGVDLDRFRPCENSESASLRDCVFVGALDYRANVDGIDWFCNEVWREFRRRRPDATFTLVGSQPSALVRRLAKLPGVCLTEDVGDVRPYLAQAALVVVPLRIARGIQNKVLEALAMAKAVIATPQALEGLDVEPGVHVCQAQASRPSEWIENIAALLDDPQARARLGRAGRTYVEAHHRWDRELQPLAALLGLPEA